MTAKLVSTTSSDYCKLNSCALNCSTNQEDFVTNVHDKEYTVDNKQVTFTAIESKLAFDASCGSFMSCYKSALFQTLEATKNLIGFYKFFGEGNLTQIPDDEKDESCKLNS